MIRKVPTFRDHALGRRPWGECILRPLQDRGQLQEVAQQHGGHIVALDPVDPRLGIDGRRVVVGKQAIAPEPRDAALDP
jgi:hypothetical protein